MGAGGATVFYDPGRNNALDGTGIANSFGNPNLREEQADTWTMGVAMSLFDDWRLTVDWWKIQIEQMIALESADTTYQKCLDKKFNPTADLATRPASASPGIRAPARAVSSIECSTMRVLRTSKVSTSQ